MKNIYDMIVEGLTKKVNKAKKNEYVAGRGEGDKHLGRLNMKPNSISYNGKKLPTARLDSAGNYRHMASKSSNKGNKNYYKGQARAELSKSKKEKVRKLPESLYSEILNILCEGGNKENKAKKKEWEREGKTGLKGFVNQRKKRIDSKFGRPRNDTRKSDAKLIGVPEKNIAMNRVLNARNDKVIFKRKKKLPESLYNEVFDIICEGLYESLANDTAAYKMGSKYHSGQFSRGYKLLSKASSKMEKKGISDPSRIASKETKNITRPEFRKEVAKKLKGLRKHRKDL